MEKRLFIITNNTHYLNTRKYIDSHEEADNQVLLLVNPYKGYSELVDKIKADKELKILKEIFSPPQRSFAWRYLDIFRMMARIRMIGNDTGPFDHVFFTNYKSWIQHYILKQFPLARKIYISDGTAIFPVARRRKKDRSIPFSGNTFFVEKILRLKPIKQLHFFSPIDLDLAEYDSIEVFRYDSPTASRIDSEKIYFIGGPLVELNKLSEEVHLKYLEALKKQYPGKRITYFAHRREKQENLEKYQFLGEVIRDNLSFEERLAGEKELPYKVISYVSSVLVNLAPVYPDVGFHYLDLKKEDLPQKGDFADKYFLLKDNFQNVRLQNLKKLPIEMQRL